jgi:hypothetical protein
MSPPITGILRLPWCVVAPQPLIVKHGKVQGVKVRVEWVDGQAAQRQR